MLLQDLDYCLDVISDTKTDTTPSLKVTSEGVFFAGQYFDALQCVKEILSSARRSVVIIDGYIDHNVLNLIASKGASVEVSVLTKSISDSFRTLAIAFNKPYGMLSVRTSDVFHDRFVIIDDRDFYHFGASIKDLGRRGFMFSRIEETLVVDELRKQWTNEWKKAKVEI